MKSEVSTQKQIHHKVKILSILKGIVSIDNEFRVQYWQELKFIHDWLNTLFMHDPGFQHFFHRELLNFFTFDSWGGDSPDFSKASSTDGILILEKSFV